MKGEVVSTEYASGGVPRPHERHPGEILLDCWIGGHCPDRLASHDISAQPHVCATIAWLDNNPRRVSQCLSTSLFVWPSYCGSSFSPVYCMFCK